MPVFETRIGHAAIPTSLSCTVILNSNDSILKNRLHRSLSSRLLEAWGIAVDPNVSDAALSAASPNQSSKITYDQKKGPLPQLGRVSQHIPR